MIFINIFYWFYQFFVFRILKRRIIFNYKKYCANPSGNALLYYKIDPFINPSLAKKYHHTNQQEILEIVKILNNEGFIVDIADRDIRKKDFRKLKASYDLFIGLGAGNSGKYFGELARIYPMALKILYAAGPEPSLSNALIESRYKYFSERHPGTEMVLRRMITAFNFGEFVKLADVLFVVGNEFSISSYKKFNLPVYPIYPSTSPILKFNDKPDKSVIRNFLYFGGNGNIVKGLDLLIESFSLLPHLNLYICAPTGEDDFNSFYLEMLKKATNIHYIGFIKPGGKVFKYLVKICGFVILPSCSEGIATSVVTCMRCGLVPVVTYESGVDTGDFGYIINDLSNESLTNQIQAISTIDDETYLEKSLKTYLESEKYTLKGFINSFSSAVKQSLAIKKNS